MNWKIMRFVLLMVTISSLAFTQTTYYISSSQGNNSNIGTSKSAPFKDIWKINNINLQPGDSVLLKRGDIWYGMINDTLIGTPAKPIVIGAYGTGNRPIINSNLADKAVTWTEQPGYPGLYKTYAPHTLGYVAWEFYNGKWNQLQFKTGEGMGQKWWLDSFSNGTFSPSHNMSFWDTCWVKTHNGGPLNRDSLYYIVTGNCIFKSKNVIIRDLDFTNGQYGIWMGQSDSNVTIRNVKIHRVFGIGVWTGSTEDKPSYSLRVDSCDVDSTGNSPIYLSQSWNGVFEWNDFNFVSTIIDGLPFGGGDQGALGIQGKNGPAFAGERNLIQFNRFSNAPIALDGYWQTADTIRYNTFVNVGEGLYPHGRDIVIEYNSVTMAPGLYGWGGYGGTFVPSSGSTGRLRWNYLKNCGGNGYAQVIGTEDNASMVSEHNKINANPVMGEVFYWILDTLNIKSDYNIFYGTPPYTRFVFLGTYPGNMLYTYETFAAFQSAVARYGYDVHSAYYATDPGVDAPTLIYPTNNLTNQSLTPTLTWEGPAGANTWQVQISTANTFSTIVYDDSTRETNKSTAKLNGATTYYWRVRTTTSTGQSPWSSIFSFTTLGSPVEPESFIFTLCNPYPNPVKLVGGYAKTRIPYSLGQASWVRLSISDSLGKEIKVLVNKQVASKGEYYSTWDATKITSGKYTCKIILTSSDGRIFNDSKIIEVKK